MIPCSTDYLLIDCWNRKKCTTILDKKHLSQKNTLSTKWMHSAGSCKGGISGVRCAVWLLVVSVLILGPWTTCAGPTKSPTLQIHHLTKRSFFDIQCKGVYDKSIFAKLDRICEDCYNLFREVQLHSLCRKDCFTTHFFKGCIEALQLQDEMKQIQIWIKQIHGAEPEV